MAVVKKIAIYIIRLALLGATIYGLVVAGEYATRYLLRDITTTGDNGSYFARKWRLQESSTGKSNYNSWGRREVEFDEVAPENTYRILAIGDSITYGQGIPVEERFTNRLASALAGSETQFQVLNFGKSGMNFSHHIREVKKVLKLNPDYILLQWYVNDLENKSIKGRPNYHNLAPTRELHRNLHVSSALYYVLNAGWHALQRYVGTAGSYVDYMNKRFLDPESEDSKDALGKFRKILDIASNQDIPIGVVLVPRLRAYLAKDYPFDYLHERFISVCIEDDVPYVDLREDFKPFGNDIRSLHVNKYDAHPNGFANEIIANRIMEEFEPIWRRH